MSEVHRTCALDALVAVFRLLSPSEQEDALSRCQEIWIEHEASVGSETAQAIQSVKRVAELLGEAPGIEAYKEIRNELGRSGEELMPSSQIIRVLGSWHLAKEAVDLAETSTARKINERFRKRRLGKVWRYTDETLGETLRRCADSIGHVPQVAEFEWWRERELELAQARNVDLHLPSPGPYRRRYGSWEQALLRFGFTPDEVKERLERVAQKVDS